MHRHTEKRPAAERQLRLALMLTLGFTGVEAVGGLLSGSLTLVGDAGHMLTDSFALGIASLAAWLARRPPTARHSFGLGRAEVIAALINALLMLGVVVGITSEAFERLQSPRAIAGGAVMLVATAGLAVNLIVAALLHRGESTLNIRAALLHVLGDLLGSVAALAAGAVVYFTGWTPIDPLLALVVCVLILYSTLRLLRDSLHVVMEGVPPELDLPTIGREMARTDGVMSVHDLHVWTLASGHIALSAHVLIADMRQWTLILERLNGMLNARFDITHVTLQPETHVEVLQPFRRRPEDKR